MVFVALVAGLLLATGLLARAIGEQAVEGWRTTPVYDPPVYAGRRIAEFYCSGTVYARTGDGRVVLVTTGHCGDKGTKVPAPGGRPGIMGTFSDHSVDPTCNRPDKSRCAAGDTAYIVLEPPYIPWGHLDQVDMGAGGYRTITPDMAILSCADIALGDPVEVNGRDLYRRGGVAQKGPNDFPGDGSYFPCIVAADIKAGIGDSGGLVLVRGLPAGVVAREFGGLLGFTPLAESLAEMKLAVCTDPDCGLTPPAPDAASATP